MAKRVNESGVVRRSGAQGRALVGRWRASGESITSFCRQAEVRANVLRYWLARETAPVERGSDASDFFVVTAPQRAPQTEGIGIASETGAERRSTSAFIVVIPAASPGMLARTVRELLGETSS
jgi:hypothetical protein